MANATQAPQLRVVRTWDEQAERPYPIWRLEEPLLQPRHT